MRFAFRLKSILLMREQVREEALKVYVEALQRRLEQEDSCNQLQEKIDNLLNNNNFDASFTPVDRIHFFNSIKKLEAHLEASNELLANLIEDENAKLSKFLEAKQEVEVLEKLKDKRLNEFLADQLKLEEKAVDDWVQGNFRKSRA